MKPISLVLLLLTGCASVPAQPKLQRHLMDRMSIMDQTIRDYQRRQAQLELDRAQNKIHAIDGDWLMDLEIRLLVLEEYKEASARAVVGAF